MSEAADPVGSPGWRTQQLDRLLEFAVAAQLPGAGFGWLDDDGRPDASRPVHTWITARMTHVFALAQSTGRPGAAELVAHGVHALLGPLQDREHGGWWTAVGDDGPTGTDKHAYDHAFVLLAASSALAVGAEGAADLMARARDVFSQHFWDDDAGKVVETWDRGWSTVAAYRGANSNMHWTEALLAAHAATGEALLARQAERIALWFLDAARTHDWRLPEHYDADWRPELEHSSDRRADPFFPYGSTVGHGLEWARLALHLRAAPGTDGSAKEQLLEDAVRLFDRATTDGWAVDGAAGFVYTVDWQGTPVVRDRMHWVLTEGIATAAVLEQATGDGSYVQWQQRLWAYADEYLLDPRDGSWRHQLDPDNRPTATIWAGKPDAYHAVQALLLPGLPITPGVLSCVLASPGFPRRS